MNIDLLKEKIFIKNKELFDKELLTLFINSQTINMLNIYINDNSQFCKNYNLFEKEINGFNKINHESIDILSKIKDSPNKTSGLENIGNTCYFNSIIQILFNIPCFYDKIMKFDFKLAYKEVYSDNEEKDNIKNSLDMLKEIKLLFGYLTIGNLKYYNPSNIINKLIDYNGKKFKWGHQKDISEFSLLFYSRLEEVLNLNKNNELRESIKKSFCNSSFMPNNIKKLDSDDLELKLFFGNKISEINNSINYDNKEAFHNIMININSSNIYSWIEESFIIKDKNYYKYEWIDSFPEILNIQLKRFEYNKINNQFTKINDYFKIENFLNLSRFEFKNRNKVIKIKEELKNEEKKIKLIKDKIKDIENFDNKNTVDTIDNFKKLISSQEYYNSINLPINLNKEFIKLIEKSEEKINNKLIELNKELQDLEKKYYNIWNFLDKNIYEIFSIIIHDGSTISNGHYYVIIKQNNIWLKYNDINIEELKEEEVFKISNGEYKGKSAYCWIYKKLKNLNSEKNYNKLIDINLKQIVENNNIENEKLKYIQIILNNEENFEDNIKFEEYRQIINTKERHIPNIKQFYDYLFFKEFENKKNKNYYYDLSKSIYKFNKYKKLINELDCGDFNKEELLDKLWDKNNIFNFKFFIEDKNFIFIKNEYNNYILKKIYLNYSYEYFNTRFILNYIVISKYIIFNPKFYDINDDNDYFIKELIENIKLNLLGFLIKIIFSSLNDIKIFWNEANIIIKESLNILIKNNKVNNYYLFIIKLLNYIKNKKNKLFNIESFYFTFELFKEHVSSNLIEKKSNEVYIDINEINKIENKIINSSKIINNLNKNFKENNFNFDEELYEYLYNLDNLMSENQVKFPNDLVILYKELINNSKIENFEISKLAINLGNILYNFYIKKIN